MTTSPGVHDAHASLLDAAAARERLIGRARWTRRYFSLFAVASLVMVPTIGMGGVRAVLPTLLGWAVVMVALIAWAKRQGVIGRGSWRLHGFTWGAWGVLWMVTVNVGVRLYPGVAAFWLPAALVVTAPLVVAAVVAGRTGRTAGPR